MLRRIAPLLTVAALAATGLAAQTSTVALGSTKARLTPTAFAMEASGYSSRVKGGDVPTGSDRSAFTVTACTNLAGESNTNHQAEADLGSGMGVSNARTRTWTTRSGDTVTSHSRNTIERLTLADTPTGSLYLDALVSSSKAWHDGSGFHSQGTSSLGAIVLDPAADGLPDQSFPVPSPGQAVTVPGVATISMGVGKETISADAAAVNLDAVKIKTLFSDTVVFAAHSRATIEEGVKTAMYGGSSFATKVGLVDGSIGSGRTPATLVPCVGSDGTSTVKSVDHMALDPGMNGSGLRSSQQSGLNSKGQSEVTTRARINHLNLGGGLVLRGISARAHVVKTADGYVRDTLGTGIGSVMFQGDAQDVPDSGEFEIPGVALFEPNIVHKTARGVTVTALRVTLLDGRGAVIDLGYAKAFLQPSGL